MKSYGLVYLSFPEKWRNEVKLDISSIESTKERRTYVQHKDPGSLKLHLFLVVPHGLEPKHFTAFNDTV